MVNPIPCCIFFYSCNMMGDEMTLLTPFPRKTKCVVFQIFTRQFISLKRTQLWKDNSYIPIEKVKTINVWSDFFQWYSTPSPIMWEIGLTFWEEFKLTVVVELISVWITNKKKQMHKVFDLLLIARAVVTRYVQYLTHSFYIFIMWKLASTLSQGMHILSWCVINKIVKSIYFFSFSIKKLMTNFNRFHSLFFNLRCPRLI